AIDAGDKGAGLKNADADSGMLGSSACTVDVDVVTAMGEGEAGPTAQSDVEVPDGHIAERTFTDGRVVAAGGEAIESLVTDGCVAVPIALPVAVRKRTITDSRVAAASGILIEGSKTDGRVVGAGGVAQERLKNIGGIGIVGDAFERAKARGRACNAGDVGRDVESMVGWIAAAA